MTQRYGVLIMEDNAPVHVHNYHDYPRERLGISKLIWPANSPDLNPIECIWMEMKDSIKNQIGVDFTAAAIRRLVLNEWRNYPVDRINQYVLSMSRRIEACIADNGGNSFNF
jgi:transposase